MEKVHGQKITIGHRLLVTIRDSDHNVESIGIGGRAAIYGRASIAFNLGFSTRGVHNECAPLRDHFLTWL
ncbi:MAG TPA: hypothetical protein VN684_03470 [Terriglobales bacterium]|nr:hypothetical protein [Terriglobales bacterium]